MDSEHNFPDVFLQKRKYRFTRGDDNSTSQALEELITQGVAFLCFGHFWRKKHDDLLIELHETLMTTHKSFQGNFLNANGWIELQRLFAERDSHFIGLHYLQMRFHKINPANSPTKLAELKNENLFRDVKMYRKWSRNDDSFILSWYDQLLRERAGKGLHIVGAQYADYVNLQKDFIRYLPCVPYVPQLKDRLELLLEKRTTHSREYGSTSQV